MKSEQLTLLHLPWEERKIPSLLWRRCSGTAGFKGLVLNLIEKPLMRCWLPGHPSSAPQEQRSSVQLPVPQRCQGTARRMAAL